ncbi:TOBE domain-containing protein [Beijerinckia mobilis]|uniref:TOBE domain-containing protein n=1 Tax=Beijerinckia mobilis TaxID=231434 RepID=UPI001FD92D6B|nr:TOBE domain-containing protein [Beijerinckia mobilis]
MRAILSGTVSSIENKGPFARVLVTLEGRDRLAVTVTRQAVEDMNLQNGPKVFALIKSASIDEGLLSHPAS